MYYKAFIFMFKLVYFLAEHLEIKIVLPGRPLVTLF